MKPKMIKLIRILSDYTEFVTASSLAANMDVSTRSIKSYIQEINSFIPMPSSPPGRATASTNRPPDGFWRNRAPTSPVVPGAHRVHHQQPDQERLPPSTPTISATMYRPLFHHQKRPSGG